MAESYRSHGHQLSTAGVLITLGIIFGDIGTSPIYVMNAIVSSHIISKELVLGGLSCVFWTLMEPTLARRIPRYFLLLIHNKVIQAITVQAEASWGVVRLVIIGKYHKHPI